MNLRQLEVFYAIMTTGSVTAAARRLHVSQPAISNVLKHTEEQLKFRLFERRGGRLYPTPEASNLLPDVNEIFGRLDTLNRVVQEMRDGKTGHLVIATSPTLIHVLVPRAVALLREHNPTLNVSVLSLPTALAIERISRREADIGIIYAPADNPGVDAEDLITTEIACVMPKGHPLASKRAFRIGDLSSEAIISLGAQTRLGRIIEDEFRKANATPPQIRIDAGSSVAACLMVSEGAGIALVDLATTASGKFNDLVFRTFRPKITVTIQLIFLRARPRSRATLYLAEHLRASLLRKPISLESRG